MRRSFWSWNKRRNLFRLRNFYLLVLRCKEHSKHKRKIIILSGDLQKEIKDLSCKLLNISSLPDESAKKLKEDYLHKLNSLEAQVLLCEYFSLAVPSSIFIILIYFFTGV
jgi:hypothetical protein